MKIFSFNLVVLLLCHVLFVSNAFSGKKYVPEVASKEFKKKIKSISMSEKRFKKLVKKMRKINKRKIASLDNTVSSKLDSSYVKLTKKFLEIKDVDVMADFMNTNKKFIKNCLWKDCGISDDELFFRTYLYSVTPFESITYRLRKYVEKYPYGQTLFVSPLRVLATISEVWKPNNSTQNLLSQYMTAPTKYTFDKEIKTAPGFTTYLSKEYLSVLSDLMIILDRKIGSQKEYVIWDNKVMAGNNSFPDGIQRYQAVTMGDRYAMASYLAQVASNWSMYLAYNTHNILEVFKSLGHLYGVDSFTSSVTNRLGIWRDISGAPASARKKVFDNKKYKTFLKKHAGTSYWMGVSFKYLKRSVDYGQIAWTELKERKSNELGILSYFQIPTGTQTFLNDGVEKVREAFPEENENGKFITDKKDNVIKGNMTFSSLVSNETVKFDVYEFYHNPPADLKNFLPKDFVRGKKNKERTFKTQNGKKFVTKYRNYLYGSPLKWQIDKFSKYFKNVEKDEDIPRNIRVLSESYASPMATPFFMAVY